MPPPRAVRRASRSLPSLLPGLLPSLLPGLLLALLLGALPGCGGPAEGDALERIRARGELVVATEAEFPPFESVDATGRIVGFDVDLAQALADDLGVRLVLRNVRFEAIIPELLSGKADLILSGLTVTEERRRSVRFSEPYFYTITCLLVRRGLEGQVRSVSDLDDPARTLAVKEGTTGEAAARAKAPRARRVSHKTENAAALDVAEGRADAFLYDLSSVRQHQRQHPERTFLIETPITYEPYAAAFRPEDAPLAERMDRLLAALRADGRLRRIAERHGPEGSLEAR